VSSNLDASSVLVSVSSEAGADLAAGVGASDGKSSLDGETVDSSLTGAASTGGQ